MYHKGYVYLIEDVVNGTYKIGRTKHNPNIRLKQLQTGNANELRLVCFYKTDWPCRMESLLHNRFEQCNVNYDIFNKKYKKSEWYYLNKDQVNTFEDSCKEINNMINVMKDNVYFNKNLK